MKQSTRLIVNTGAMFGRMALTIGISLLITRLLLGMLGEVDFGLLLALGAAGTILQTVSGALTVGMQRQLNYEIANGNSEAIRRAFSTGWVIYMVLGVALWLIGVALTPLVMHGLSIPVDRADAAWWVYQLALLNLVLVVTATPYQAIIIAHQHLTLQAFADVFTSLTRLAAVFLALTVAWDRMVTFAAFQLAGYAVVRWSLNLYCLWRYPNSLPHPRHCDRQQIRDIFRIAMWSVFGQLSTWLRMQGGILLLNIFFGPAVNGAYGIAMQLANYATTVSNSISQAVSPAIVGAHAKGNRLNFHRLALVTGKYLVLILSFAVVPFWLEAEQGLQLWLGDLPPYTVILTRGVLAWMMVQMFTIGYLLANWAVFDVGWYTRRLLLSSALILLAAGAGFYAGLPPWFLPVSALAGVLAMTLVAVWGIGATIELPPSRWVFEALLPTLGVVIPATILAGIVHWTMPDGVGRFITVFATYAIIAAPMTWWIALADWERERFIAFARAAFVQRSNRSKRRTEASRQANQVDETIA